MLESLSIDKKTSEKINHNTLEPSDVEKSSIYTIKENSILINKNNSIEEENCKELVEIKEDNIINVPTEESIFSII